MNTFTLISLFFLHLTNTSIAQTLSFTEFQAQVHQLDPSWRAAELNEAGSHLLTDEADSITEIQFTSQLSYLKDRRPTANPSFQGDQTDYHGLMFGFKQQTSWGAQWSITQNYGHTQIFNAATTAIPVPDYYDSFPKLDFNISLWRNFAGAEVSAQIMKAQKMSVLRSKASELERLQKEIEIEDAYNTAASLQQSYEAQKDGFERAEKLLAWTRKRIARNLADNSDVYQSQAAVAFRKLELISTKTNLSKAIEKFNSLRGVASNELKETLQLSDVNSQTLILSKNNIRVRKDIRLKEFEIESNEASYRALREQHKPQLDLSLSALDQGRDVSKSEAQSKVFHDSKDYLQVAVTLNIPLNQFKESDFRKGYNLLSESQIYKDKSRTLDESIAWKNNVDFALQLHDQLTALQELEGFQKNKANAEQDKFNRGRSTLFQVLTYEQDYITARSQKINIELQARQFISQLKLFE